MEQGSLFDDRAVSGTLADRMRPETLEEYAGQKHLRAEDKILRRMIDRDGVQSMIFWGPPGVGKTTLAKIIARCTESNFINFSAVTSGIREIKEVMNKAEQARAMGEKTIVFVDEIHRFNKAQQDAFLPYVERGSIILIGATTENPSFEINNALLSRCKVFVMQPLTQEDITELLKRALKDPRGFGSWEVEIDDSLIDLIAVYANGDARTALPGQILFKVSPSYAVTKATAGMDREEHLLVPELGEIRFERLFPACGRFEKRTREAGLDRWFIADFSKDVPVARVAEYLRSSENVEAVEYEQALRLAAEELIYSVHCLIVAGFPKRFPSVPGP